ncbi:hypothetical protein DM02DRAFT_729115 [Periconia macrospinosa]|uniref:DUF1330 domain-containing protein n=1 Tax=Periconia macrospinosa TaxID=97972 RepID=A0A2V1DNK7_9PLEO|nr:hypothetical protein DM02DRAFT_729115 [Periconia macrospinosa]
MPVYPLNHEVLASLTATRDPSKPVFMLNLWKFREHALYAPEHASLAGAPCSGREAATERYVDAIRPVMPQQSDRYFMASVAGFVAGPIGEKGEEEKWDLVTIVRYETLQGFVDMVSSRKYIEEVEPHRLAGLEDFRLVAMDMIDL